MDLTHQPRQGGRRLVAVAVGAWTAAAGGTLLAPRASLAGAVAAFVGALVMSRLAGVVPLVLMGIAMGIAGGALAAAWHVHQLHAGLVPRLAARRANVEVVARLVRDPVALTTVSGSALTLTDATVTSVLDGPWRTVSSPILVLSYGGGWAGMLPGQRVDVTGRLSPPRRGDDVAAVLDARAPPTLLGRPPWWQRAAGRVRRALRTVCGGLPPDERGLLPGLVDGDVSAEPAVLKGDMRVTGLTHLQAVSGENVSVILGVTIAIARALGLRRRSRIALTAIALVGFVVLARPSPSVLRAAVMGGIALAALAVGRRASPVRALSLAIILLVVVNPFLARQVGFALSVCATAALLTVAPTWTDRLARWMPRSLAATIAVPAAAQLACTPILVLTFGQLTPYAVPANLLAAPAVAPATILGVVAAVIATGWSPLAIPIAWLAAAPTGLIAGVARIMANAPAAGLAWPGGVGLDLFVGLIVVAILIRHRLRRRARRAHAILGTWQP